MERSDRKLKFAKHEQVHYQGNRWFWGPRSGSHRVLIARPGTGNGGIMVPENDIFQTVFPAPHNGIHLPHHAIRWDHATPRSVRIRLHAVQTAPDCWFGAIKAKYGTYEGLFRDEPLCQEIHATFKSENAVVREMLQEVFSDLHVLSKQGAHGLKLAKQTAASMLENLPAKLTNHLHPIGEAL